MTHHAETQYGFKWGAAEVSRTLSDERGGVVVTIATTAGQVVHVRVTPSGRILVGQVGRRGKGGPGWFEKGAPIP
jgi:hypothetical protein